MAAYELKHNHPGSALYGEMYGTCEGCQSRARAVNAVAETLTEQMGFLPLSTRGRAAWNAVTYAEGALRMLQRKQDAQIASGATEHAHPTIPSHEGVPSDQRTNQTPLTPAENEGAGRRSNDEASQDTGFIGKNCSIGAHPVCRMTNCNCKCHAIRAAYSG